MGDKYLVGVSVGVIVAGGRVGVRLIAGVKDGVGVGVFLNANPGSPGRMARNTRIKIKPTPPVHA